MALSVSNLQILWKLFERACTEVNKVRFKEKILSHFHEAQAQNDGKNILLIFQQGMQQILKHALNTDYEGDAMILAKAASIIRKNIFDSLGFHFSGSFPPGCQQESVPINLKYLLSMLLNGGIKTQQIHRLASLYPR